MRLSDNERRVIAAVEGQAERPLTQLERATKLRASAVRYHLNHLIDRGVLTYYPFIDTFRLGYTHHNFFFALSYEGKAKEAALVEYLIRSEAVCFLAELGGGYHYAMSLIGRSAKEIRVALDQIGARFGAIFSKLDYAAQLSLSLFPTKYLQHSKEEPRIIACGECEERVEVDELDRRILSTLVNERYRSRRDVARMLGLPISTLDYRLKRLADEKVIVDFVYLTNPSIFGMLEFKLLLHLKGHDPKLHAELVQFARQHPHIVVLIECVGGWAYELSVEVETPSMLANVLQDLHRKFGSHIAHIQELSLFKQRKVSCFPFAVKAAGSAKRVANAG